MFRRVSNLKASSLDRPLNHRLQTALLPRVLSPPAGRAVVMLVSTNDLIRRDANVNLPSGPVTTPLPELFPFLSRFWRRKVAVLEEIPSRLLKLLPFVEERWRAYVSDLFKLICDSTVVSALFSARDSAELFYVCSIISLALRTVGVQPSAKREKLQENSFDNPPNSMCARSRAHATCGVIVAIALHANCD